VKGEDRQADNIYWSKLSTHDFLLFFRSVESVYVGICTHLYEQEKARVDCVLQGIRHMRYVCFWQIVSHVFIAGRIS